MNSSQIYILVVIIILAAIALTVFLVKKQKKEKLFSPLTDVAFVLMIAGIAMGDNRVISYSLMGVGIILAIVDTVKRKKK